MIARYGAAVEADLANLGLDLGALWRGRQWRRLLNLIDHLPRHSHFVEALANDEELAEAQAALPEGKGVQRLSEWTADHDLLVNIFDRLGDVIAALVAVNGGQPPTISRFPRPVTAIDEARQRARHQAHDRLVGRLLGPERR